MLRSLQPNKCHNPKSYTNYKCFDGKWYDHLNQLIAQLKAGQRCNACGIALTNNGKNNSYKSKLESLLNLNIIDAILSRSLGVFHIESFESHRFTNVESYTVCSLDYLKGTNYQDIVRNLYCYSLKMNSKYFDSAKTETKF